MVGVFGSEQQPAFFFGGDYYPEQWDETVWQEDMVLMQQAGVNLVTLGVFAWARLEPKPGEYSFDWLDRIVALLDKNRIGICLATATASPPPWLSSLCPESLPVTSEGVRLAPGSRQHYCPHNPDFRRHASALVAELARRYGRHPAVKFWHIHNEYGCHVAECFCDACAQAFRTWLRQKYRSLERLNHAWGTAFWSQQIGDWQEIFPPRHAPTFINPAQQLDWRRFSSDSLLELYRMEKAILRSYSDLPTTTNVPGYFKALDLWKWAENQEIISLDCYPDPANPKEAAVDMALNADLMRSLGKGQPWVLMEQAPGAVNWRARNLPKAPGQMRLWSLQAVAHGAKAVMFFQWRASRAGAEKFHSAMISHAGAGSTRTWQEVLSLGQELKDLAALIPARNLAQVAILMDWDNWWALELGSKPSAGLNLVQQLRDHYTALHHANIPVDFVHPGADLSPYRLVIAPSLYLIRQAEAENLIHYVEQGGTLLVSFFSGIVDENDQVWLGGYPGPLRRLLGVWVEEFVPLESEQNAEVSFAGGLYRGELWSEVIHLESAQAVGDFQDGFSAGGPAMTRNRLGKGQAYYLGTHLEPSGTAMLYRELLEETGLTAPLNVPEGVEAAGRGEYLFLLNHSASSAKIHLPASAWKELRTGNTCQSELELPGYGVEILQRIVPTE